MGIQYRGIGNRRKQFYIEGTEEQANLFHKNAGTSAAGRVSIFLLAFSITS